eukprot:105604-Chlamydomonas_euryale.AAC.4
MAGVRRLHGVAWAGTSCFRTYAGDKGRMHVDGRQQTSHVATDKKLAGCKTHARAMASSLADILHALDPTEVLDPLACAPRCRHGVQRAHKFQLCRRAPAAA